MRTIDKEPSVESERPTLPVRNRMAEQGKDAFDFTCRHYLNISGQEFLDLHRNGHFEGATEMGVSRALAMLPFAL